MRLWVAAWFFTYLATALWFMVLQRQYLKHYREFHGSTLWLPGEVRDETFASISGFLRTVREARHAQRTPQPDEFLETRRRQLRRVLLILCFLLVMPVLAILLMIAVQVFS